MPQSPDDSLWQMDLLNQGLNCRKLSPIRVKVMLRALIQECLFELSLSDRLFLSWQAASFPASAAYRSIALSVWERKMILIQTGKMQEQWQAAGLTRVSPAASPILRNEAEALTLCDRLPLDLSYLRGGFTFWEIASHLNKSLEETIGLLKPFIEDGTLKFATVPDFARLAIQPLSSNLKTASGLKTLEPTATAQKTQSNAKPETARSNPQPEPAGHNQPLIACIDDSPVLAHSLKKILVSAGYEALIIQEPMRGFSQLIEHKPALILLDIMLPNADGYSICKFLRDTPAFKATPIIILTGQSKPVDYARARIAGATEFLVKPPKPDQLLNVIQEHLAVESPV
ncbi:MAG: response regulator [Elainellaceae cyanobacterium]